MSIVADSTHDESAAASARSWTKPDVLLAHNFYQQAGGEDSVLRAETEMLSARGHRVHQYLVHNDDIAGMSRVRLAASTVWSTQTLLALGEQFERHKVQVAHFHNTFPLISPAGYFAAKRRGIAVVQTLHNYRLLCPAGNFYRDGGVCERCLDATMPWPAVLHGCYRGSRAATAAVTTMLSVHRARRTYARAVDVYIALTEFARRKFIEGGLPAEKIVVKPNFCADPGVGRHDDGSVLFVGRLTVEKGIEHLLHAWQRVVQTRPGLRLRILGDGPCINLSSSGVPGVEWLGWRSREEVTRRMQDAALLVLPSVQREGFPMTLVEAFATGLPVLAADFESMTEMVRDNYSGRLFAHGDARDLATVLEQTLADSDALRALGRQARTEYEGKYTPASNYEQLMAIYRAAMRQAA